MFLTHVLKFSFVYKVKTEKQYFFNRDLIWCNVCFTKIKVHGKSIYNGFSQDLLFRNVTLMVHLVHEAVN